MNILERLGVFPILPTSFVSPPSLILPAFLPARDQALCGQTHRTQGADSLEGEGFWPVLWYVVCQSFDNGITMLHSIRHTVGIQ